MAEGQAHPFQQLNQNQIQTNLLRKSGAAWLLKGPGEFAGAGRINILNETSLGGASLYAESASRMPCHQWYPWPRLRRWNPILVSPMPKLR